MQKSLSVLLVSAVILTGCGESRLNPKNWFGRGRSVPVAESAGDVNPLIPSKGRLQRRDPGYQGRLVGEIKSLVIEQVPGGAIARVTGVSDVQGPYEVKLIALNDGKPVNGVLSYELRALTASRITGGTERSRSLTAAVYVTNQNLSGVREIRITGARNAQSSRRR
ncbi:hypothetical protein TG4357_03780 [Thalassovita gelatinovora]|uniref:Lipoprotein n=1 Tax=Thalassovita gelatinovora TaxID=53501 RepID=A0A0P1FKS9_THAGE|nr:hypothetical protein [Thalassovita gelatinovora]QIZ79107.1 hypothetical protein HFZ77_00755 [Thalassovita gelatinovora]CUH68758.1 hypothetical protein TG4357_03780 [Thalassovita gelatinovora]SEQ58027.1 hypothetical protein SAMN04488043_106241 [Thalassovita gelatinovora]